jgi:hypothetical protein
MYRKPKQKDRSAGLDLDSLMDILSCLVGVMLFLVIYTVLELGSAAYQAEVVVSPNRVPNSRRVVVLAERGTLRMLDVRPALAELLSGFEIVRSVAEVQVFVDASGSAPVDPYFDYSLGFQVRATTDLLGMLDLVIDERTGTVGESIDELGPDSRYGRALAALDPMQSWIAFAVDEESVDLFRRAREQAIALGFATGFDLLSLDFPMTLPLTSGGINDLLSPIGTLDKPER